MADENSQVQTETTPASTAGEPTPTPAAAPAAEATAPVSTTPPTAEPSDSAGEVAGGVAGYEAMKDQMIAKAGKTPAPAEAAPASDPAATPDPSETPAGETPAAQPTATDPTETPADPAAQPTASATPSAPAEEEEAVPDRIRIASLPDSHLVATAATIAREEKISFKEAFARVSGESAAAAPAAGEPAATPGSTTARSRATVEAELNTAKQQRRAAATSADALEQGAAGKLVDAEETIERLQDELGQIGQVEEQAEFDRESTAQREFSTTVSKSKAKAVQYWPDAGKDGTELSKTMHELSDQYERDPALSHHAYKADAPFFFAELAATKLKMLPAHMQTTPAGSNGQIPANPQPATPPPTKPAPVNQRAVVRPVQPATTPASGTARTTQEPAKPNQAVDNIKSVTDYEQVKKDMLAGKA